MGPSIPWAGSSIPTLRTSLKPFLVRSLNETHPPAWLARWVVGSGPVSPWSLDKGVPGVGPQGFCTRLLQRNRFRLKDAVGHERPCSGLAHAGQAQQKPRSKMEGSRFGLRAPMGAAQRGGSRERDPLPQGQAPLSALGLVCPELLHGSIDDIRVTATKPGKAMCNSASVLKSQGKPAEQLSIPGRKRGPSLHGVCYFSQF